MAKYAKGQSGNPAGRPPGPNKVSREFRDTVRRLLEDNAENVSLWLSQVAATDPDKALDKLARLAEFAAPKLGRVEHTGLDGGPIKVQASEMSDDDLASIAGGK